MSGAVVGQDQQGVGGMTQVAILDDYQNVALDMADWDSLPDDVEVEVFDDHVADLDGVAARLEEFEIICAMRERTPFPRALIERLPNLKLLVTSGMRNAAIDLEAAADAGITVCGTRSGGPATAELTWGLILSLMRNLPIEHESVVEGGWQINIGNDLNGKTLGIIGLGRLGARVAAVGNAFGMNVVAWSQNLTAERAAEHGAKRVELSELLTGADVVTIHVVLSERTRDLLGRDELAKMKPSAILINTSRGPIVNEQALIDALMQRQIRGAGIDVYGVEPLPYDHPIRHLSNVVLTPHIGYVTEETYRLFYGDMVDDIQAYLDGKPIRVITPSPS